MRTLYDFLGALPDDDAESLRAAFRRAVKDTHPDLKPADPGAALKFRKLVRANDILSDERQRAVYDRLLHLARIELGAQKRAAVFDRIVIGVACGLIALAGILVVSVAGYSVFLVIDGTPSAPAQMTQVSRDESVSDTFSRIPRPDQPEPAEKRDVAPEDFGRATAVSVVAFAQATTGATASANVSAIRDFAASDARHYRERGILAYRSGDLYLALVDFNLAIQFDPGFSDAYIDRAIVLYRLGDVARAFADVARAMRVHNESISR